jgi:hypothetical protein
MTSLKKIGYATLETIIYFLELFKTISCKILPLEATLGTITIGALFVPHTTPSQMAFGWDVNAGYTFYQRRQCTLAANTIGR